MSIIDWFAKKEKVAPSRSREKLDIPGDLWVKCFQCDNILYLKDLEANQKVCLKCDYHFRITSKDRIAFHFDSNSFQEIDGHLKSKDFLKFVDTESYSTRIKKAQKKTKQNDAIVIGTASIKRKRVNLGIMDFSFMGGSMGSVVGEKIARVVEAAVKNRYPLIIFTSSGGARMQEGLTSLMQMAKTSAALSKLEDARVPFISVLCDPTTGGTTASFAMLGDINIGEPGALISFAGPRVIEQTIRQKMPKGFQRSEFLLEHGMLDMVLNRKELKSVLYDLITLLDPIPKKGSK